MRGMFRFEVGTALNAACLGLILSIRSNRNIVDEERLFLKTFLKFEQ